MPLDLRKKNIQISQVSNFCYLTSASAGYSFNESGLPSGLLNSQPAPIMTECHSFLTFLNLVVCPNVSVSLKNKIKKVQQISNFNSNQNINLQLALCIFLNLNIKAVSVYIRWIIWNCLPFESTPVHPRFLCGVCVAHLFVFFFVLSYYVS